MPSIKKHYPPISYIGQKYRNMINQFPPLESNEPICQEVMEMQEKISKDGYTEEEIGLFLERYQEYRDEGEIDKAAQILLLAAATESKFAQFLLARELFRGDVLKQDHAESFTQINSLADQNFAEAICDLGQFYEYGIGIEKDRQMALLLYEEAAEMNVARARKHYERLKNSQGLLGFLKKIPPLNIGRKGQL
jgi:TPR repeat protein